MTKRVDDLRRWQEAGLLRDLDVHLIESLLRTCGDAPAPPPVVPVLLALAVRVTGGGHVCLDLNRPQWEQINGGLPEVDPDGAGGWDALKAELPTPQEAADQLQACPELVCNGTGAQPFILADGRLYLRRFWNYEQRTADKLRAWAATTVELSADAKASVQAVTLSKKGPSGEDLHLTAEQVDAVCVGLQRHLTIITGGPGTGKTTIAAVLLKMLARQNPNPGEPFRVLLAAPTGKAADRLQESVDAEIDATTEPIALQTARTLDRLLGFQSSSPYFRHNREHPLPAEVVLVDETSMADLPKFAKLIDALAPHTRLILLGDMNQLASVDPGSVMAELCESETLREHVVELTESKRFADDSPIKRLSVAVNEMRAEDAWGIAHSQAEAADSQILIRDISRIRFNHIPQEFTAAIKARYAAFQAATTPAKAFAALARFRVLCTLRRGPAGVYAINRAIEDILFPHRKGEFYDHRVILVTRNDYEVNLFNGDVGVVLPDPARGHERAVFFAGREQSVPCRLLPEHETAFAMTVHKSQGSGFGHVMVMLPPTEAPILTRELLYTALTRTETGVDLWCTEESFKTAVGTQTTRSMGLKSKLDAPGPIGSTTP